jgi:hypothetical protein
MPSAAAVAIDDTGRNEKKLYGIERLNDLRSAARPTRLTRTDPSVPIRLPTLILAQRVSRICAETDVLQR